jgi:hypothetical protein
MKARVSPFGKPRISSYLTLDSAQNRNLAPYFDCSLFVTFIGKPSWWGL